LVVIFSLFFWSSLPVNAAIVYFSDDFESGLGKWVVSGSDWALIDTDSRSPTHSVTESPDGDYIPNENASMTLALPVDLSGATNPLLKFWYKIYNPDCTSFYDYAYVEVSENGGVDWDIIKSYNCVNKASWTPETLGLSAYTSSPPILIRFRFRADGDDRVGDGWYIDDVEITGDDSCGPFKLDLQVNGKNGSIEVTEDQRVTVTAELCPGIYGGTPVEWWLGGLTFFGTYWYDQNGNWVESEQPILLLQGPLPEVSVTNILQGKLPVGVYNFFSILDTSLDNEFDIVVKDGVTVYVKKSSVQAEEVLDFNLK
jgi:hypothetical protein